MMTMMIRMTVWEFIFVPISPPHSSHHLGIIISLQPVSHVLGKESAKISFFEDSFAHFTLELD